MQDDLDILKTSTTSAAKNVALQPQSRSLYGENINIIL